MPVRTAPTAATVLFLLLFQAAALAESAQNLFEARKKGYVSLEAIAMHGHQKIEITVKNLTDRSLRLAPAGSVLMPPDPSLQRLGLGGVIGGIPGEDSALILLAPNSTWNGLVYAVCLDFGRGSPPSGVPYKLSSTPATEKALKVLRYWARNPTIRQGLVNDIIWTDQDLKTLKTQVIPTWLSDSRLFAHGGSIYWLSGHRTVYETHGDGATWTLIGDNLDALAAGGGQLAGYIHRIPGLRWYNLSQRKWEYFFLTLPPEKVMLGPDRSIFVLSETKLLAYRPGQKKFEPLSAPAVAHADLGSASVSPHLVICTAGTGVVHHRPSTGGDWKKLPGKGATLVGASEKGLYARMGGAVFRFARRWKKIASAETFITGSRHCFLFSKNRVTIYDERKERISVKAVLPPGLVDRCVDRAVDRLYVLDEQGHLKMLEGGAWKSLTNVPDLGK